MLLLSLLLRYVECTALCRLGFIKATAGDVEMRWIDAYFPFTEPSFELEIFFKGEWLEVLGCGVMQQAILNEAGLPEKKAWAFGCAVDGINVVLCGVLLCGVLRGCVRCHCILVMYVVC